MDKEVVVATCLYAESAVELVYVMYRYGKQIRPLLAGPNQYFHRLVIEAYPRYLYFSGKGHTVLTLFKA